jgi:intracellular sulfur oxidation DsrE/DsrF family protein
MNTRHISEDRLNAFVDDELDAAEKSEIFEAMKQDPQLSQETCELRQLSELVRHAYDHPPEIDSYRAHRPRRISYWGAAAAASLLLALGATLGWIGHQPPPAQAAKPDMNVMYWDEHRAFQNTDLAKITAQDGTKRIIVHLNTSSVGKFETALSTAERLLETYADDEQGAEIEVVANASAIRMLRAGHTPYAQRVRELQQRYFNLTFLACKDAMDHIRELEGDDAEVELLPEVDVTPSALEHILNRLSDGWVYINV